MSDVSIVEAFFACGVIMLGLIGLVFLRYLFMVFIEFMFLERYHNYPPSFLRRFAWLLPHREVGPNSLSSSNNNNNNNNTRTFTNSNNVADMEAVTLSEFIIRVNLPSNNNIDNNNDSDRPFCHITNDIVERLIPGEIITDDWILEHTTKKKRKLPKTLLSTVETASSHSTIDNNDDKDGENRICDVEQDNSNNSSGFSTCSICIHEMCLNESAFEAQLCHHTFHTDCIRRWVAKEIQNATFRSSQRKIIEIQINNDCPNCRTPLLCDLKLRLSALVRKYNQDTQQLLNSTTTTTAATEIPPQQSPEEYNDNTVSIPGSSIELSPIAASNRTNDGRQIMNTTANDSSDLDHIEMRSNLDGASSS